MDEFEELDREISERLAAYHAAVETSHNASHLESRVIHALDEYINAEPPRANEIRWAAIEARAKVKDFRRSEATFAQHIASAKLGTPTGVGALRLTLEDQSKSKVGTGRPMPSKRQIAKLVALKKDLSIECLDLAVSIYPARAELLAFYLGESPDRTALDAVHALTRATSVRVIGRVHEILAEASMPAFVIIALKEIQEFIEEARRQLSQTEMPYRGYGDEDTLFGFRKSLAEQAAAMAATEKALSTSLTIIIS